MQPADDGFTHVATTDTEYYLSGPAQARPPEGTVKAGTRVRVLQEAGSYTRVETEDGITGYVASPSRRRRRDEEGVAPGPTVVPELAGSDKVGEDANCPEFAR
jgi:hypothetical protein